MKALFVVGTLAILIAAEDSATLVFPSNGNGSSLELGSKIEPMTRPDMTKSSASLLPQSTLPANYFLPAPRMPIDYRSEIPYEYPNFGYPMMHAVEYPVAAPPKHLIIVSFIGLLLLFAIIQNTIVSAKRKDALMDILSTRQKRNVYPTRDFNSVTPEEEDILNDDARVRCIQRTICLENRKLFNDLGTAGKILARYLTRGVEQSFDSSTGWDRLVEDAGAAGIRGEDCDVLYRDCDLPVSSGRRTFAEKKEKSIDYSVSKN